MIVADATLISCFAIRDERHSELADAVCAVDTAWAAPWLWRAEVRSALMKYVHHAGMSVEMALLAFSTAEEIIGGREYRVSSDQVFELASRSKCTVYDCEYVALAEDLDVPLVTADKQILKAFPEIAVSLMDFAKRK